MRLTPIEDLAKLSLRLRFGCCSGHADDVACAEAIDQLIELRRVVAMHGGWDHDSTEAIATSIENTLFEMSFANPEEI